VGGRDWIDDALFLYYVSTGEVKSEGRREGEREGMRLQCFTMSHLLHLHIITQQKSLPDLIRAKAAVHVDLALPPSLPPPSTARRRQDEEGQERREGGEEGEEGRWASLQVSGWFVWSFPPRPPPLSPPPSLPPSLPP